ncbi:MAG: hypothetical protein ACOYLH_06570 [Flavobacteriales bacterium]
MIFTILVLAILFAQPLVVSLKSMELRKLKWQMKTKIIQSAEPSDLISFSFSHTEWQEMLKPDPTEFVLNGIYYDIATMQSTKEGVVVTCLKDEKEAAFKAKLKRWLKDEHSPYQKTEKSIRGFVKCFNFFQSDLLHFVCSLIEKRDYFFANKGDVEKGIVIPLMGPPWLK